MITRNLAPAPSPGFHHLHHHHRHVQYHHQHSIPAPSPITIATSAAASAANSTDDQSTSPPYNSKLQAVDFSPPLIAMVVVVATAFLVITYSRLISRHLLRLLRRWRRWRRRRRRRYLPSSNGDLDSPPPLFDSPENFHVYSPYGLDDSVIKTIPLSLYTTKSSRHSFRRDCAVCLLEFEDDDYIRTLPVCSHAFHVDCIDIWLRSHANCPLCRAGVFRPESPFIPVMAARIRPSLDDAILLNTINSIPLVDQQHAIISQTPTPAPAAQSTAITEITPCIEEEPSRRNSSSNFIYSYSEDHRFDNGGGGRADMVLKRSYSFGFERSFLASDRMLVTEPSTVSPWRYRRGGGGGGSSFWSKRPSPFGSLSKARVFSFRHYRGMKSPFFRRRGGFFPLSERFSASGGGGGSSRRSKSMASPMFLRSSVAAFSSSRLRCGDPEALLSPERLSSRR